MAWPPGTYTVVAFEGDGATPTGYAETKATLISAQLHVDGLKKGKGVVKEPPVVCYIAKFSFSSFKTNHETFLFDFSYASSCCGTFSVHELVSERIWRWSGGRLVIFGSFLLILCYIVHCNE